MTETVDAVRAEPHPMLLAGQPVEGSESLPVTFPFDGSEVGSVWLADEGQLEQALAAAAAAEPEIAAIPPFRRAEVLNAAAALVLEREDELALQMTLETGNAIWETHFEVQRTAEILVTAAEEARRITGEIVPLDALPRGEGRIAYTRRFPVGTVLGITPYNAPLLLVAHKLGPAFAAGNPCIDPPCLEDAALGALAGPDPARGRRAPGRGQRRPVRDRAGRGMVADPAGEVPLVYRQRGRRLAAEADCGHPAGDPRARRQRRRDRPLRREPRLRRRALRLRRLPPGRPGLHLRPAAVRARVGLRRRSRRSCSSESRS